METQLRRYGPTGYAQRSAPVAAPAPMATKEKQNTPLKKFRAGAVSATVWENQSINEQGQPVSFRNVSFERSYKDAKGEWQNTSQLRVNDLPKAMLVLQKAYEFLAFNQEDEA